MNFRLTKIATKRKWKIKARPPETDITKFVGVQIRRSHNKLESEIRDYTLNLCISTRYT